MWCGVDTKGKEEGNDTRIRCVVEERRESALLFSLAAREITQHSRLCAYYTHKGECARASMILCACVRAFGRAHNIVCE
jgi:hypothetical protein